MPTDQFTTVQESPREEKTGFAGPLFVVGLARSGTKLLRELLNGHSQIALPSAETHFIPFAATHFSQGDFKQGSANRGKFLNMVEQSDFYRKMRQSDPELTRSFLDPLSPAGNFHSYLEAFLRHFSGSSGAGVGFIWGDKTPHHLAHMQLLKRVFPSARFLHIIRDPRARANSARAAWGADPVYAAHRWQQAIARGRAMGVEMGGDYLELRYEDLVADPSATLQQICAGLGVSWEAGMLDLARPVENRGDTNSLTRKSGTISRDANSHYRSALSAAQIRRIEEIAFDQACTLGYLDPTSMVTPRPLTGLEKIRALASDRCHTFAAHRRQFGFRGAIRFVNWHRKFDVKPSR